MAIGFVCLPRSLFAKREKKKKKKSFFSRKIPENRLCAKSPLLFAPPRRINETEATYYSSREARKRKKDKEEGDVVDVEVVFGCFPPRLQREALLLVCGR